ncbi:MAG: ABC transporter permease [Sedimentisphaerales bacterium]|nr:ABC transporter permease [Sedimentisphaerales bacterium]
MDNYIRRSYSLDGDSLDDAARSFNAAVGATGGRLMMHGNVFRLQLASDFGDRRRIALRIGVSALLALPFIFVGMPARAQATGIVMVVLFTGFFSAAVGHARLRADLRYARLTLLPMSRGVLWLDLVLASVLARLAPVMVVMAGFLIVNGQEVTLVSLIGLLGILFASLLLLTLIGMGTGRLARSNGEVHLFGALVCAMLAFISGVTPLPEKLTWLAAITVWNPISHLLTALIRLSSGPASVPRVEFVFALLMIATVTIMAILRWLSGGMRKTGKT